MTERLVYLPLGGAGEIGMNMYLYGWGAPGRERWIIVDVGVTFPNMDSSPGVDLIMPDTAWIEDRLDAVEAIFITHAHEDHVGALGHLWQRIGRRPVYARTFTGLVVQAKLEAAGAGDDWLQVVEPWPETVEAGPFSVGFLPVSHSIPEASALVIDCPAGRVLHTGDFKLDPAPQLGAAFDPDGLRGVAGDGLMALVCDSTNVFSAEPGRSEADIIAATEALIRAAPGMVVATTFASNVARLRTLARAGAAAGRAVVVLGRAMHRMLGYARTAGVLSDFPETLAVEDSAGVPRDHLLVLATGSQGEHRGASASLARGPFLGLDLSAGDMFLFSSKTIPGNDLSVARIVNQWAERGVDVVEDDARYHVSGHANRPDLEAVHRLTNPALVVPMHGEFRHLKAHADLALAAGRRAVIAPNGRAVDLSGDPGAEVEAVETGRLYLDGTRLIGALDGVIRARLRVAMRGHLSVSVVFDEDGRVMDGVWVDPLGLAEADRDGAPLAPIIEAAVEADLARAGTRDLRSDAAVEEYVARACRKACNDAIGKKPIVSVMINRLE